MVVVKESDDPCLQGRTRQQTRVGSKYNPIPIETGADVASLPSPPSKVRPGDSEYTSYLLPYKVCTACMQIEGQLRELQGMPRDAMYWSDAANKIRKGKMPGIFHIRECGKEVTLGQEVIGKVVGAGMWLSDGSLDAMGALIQKVSMCLLIFCILTIVLHMDILLA